MSKLSAEQIVQKQLDCYNNRDMEGYIALFSENVKFYDHATREVTIEGVDACREMYQSLFDASPNLKSTIIKRIVMGNVVIDHESIVGRKGSDEVLELILVFEVEEGLIGKVTVIR